MNQSKIEWQIGTIQRVIVETARVRTFVIALTKPIPFKSGQHVHVRLTALDGYQASRSYSIASPPKDSNHIELAVELIADGEVSSYFHEVAEIGDQVEIRGPIGGPFTWTPTFFGSLLMVAGGSGIVPIMSILRDRNLTSSNVRTVLLNSARSWDDIIYRTELEDLALKDPLLSVVYTLTRLQPHHWHGYDRRIDISMLEETISDFSKIDRVYICGNTGFVETSAHLIVALGVNPADIKTERFGPTG